VVDGLLPWLGLALLVVLTAAGLRFYLPLSRAVLVQKTGLVGDRWVNVIDVVVAGLLALWFAMLGHDALVQTGERAIEFGHIITGAMVYASIVIFISGLLLYRNLRLSAVFGFGALRFPSSLGRGLLYLAAAYPLLMLVQAMVYGTGSGDLGQQDVVEFLLASQSTRDRLAVLVMAVAVAPVAEEIIFRGYLYPVAKRYVGPFSAMVGSGLLFALLHGHVASIPALFTLAMCLGLAYEKSGSLLVPMIMHAIFNAVSVAAILFIL
jgi:membrane protease YdiL (CAAX protease family)